MQPRPPITKRHQDALLSAPWFADLPENVRDDVVAHCKPRVYAAGVRIHSRGKAADCMYGILEGCIRLSGVSQNQRISVLDFYGPGAWIGEVPVLDGKPRMLDAHAYERTVALTLQVEDLNRLLEAHPIFCQALLRLTAERLRIVLTAIEQYSTQSLENRLANRLLMLARSFGVAVAEGLQIDLRLSQETLAQLIGSTRQRVNQILLDWEEKDIVRQKYGRTLLRDQRRIEKLAES